jgi:hypothetical protein
MNITEDSYNRLLSRARDIEATTIRLREQIEELEEPDMLTPAEVVMQFLDYLQGFDADDTAMFLKRLSGFFEATVDDMCEKSSGSIATMMAVQCHIECAYERWQKRPGN